MGRVQIRSSLQPFLDPVEAAGDPMSLLVSLGKRISQPLLPVSWLSVSSCCGHPRLMIVGSVCGEPGPSILQTPAGASALGNILACFARWTWPESHVCFTWAQGLDRSALGGICSWALLSA